MLMDNFLSASVCSSSADRVNKGVVTAFSPGGLAHADSVLAAPHLCVACMPIFNPLLHLACLFWGGILFLSC